MITLVLNRIQSLTHPVPSEPEEDICPHCGDVIPAGVRR